MLYSRLYMGKGTVGILEDHVNVWVIVGIFWGPWEICHACILQFQFLSYIEALYMLSELSKLPELSEVLPSSKEVLLFQAFRVGDQLSEAPGAKVCLIDL